MISEPTRRRASRWLSISSYPARPRGTVTTIEFMFTGILKYVLGPTQTHVSHSRWARVKMSSERGPKHIYAQGHKLYYYYSHFESHRENKN